MLRLNPDQITDTSIHATDEAWKKMLEVIERNIRILGGGTDDMGAAAMGSIAELHARCTHLIVNAPNSEDMLRVSDNIVGLYDQKRQTH